MNNNDNILRPDSPSTVEGEEGRLMTAWERIERSTPYAEVTEGEYDYALGVLPPIYIQGRHTGTPFAVSEPLRHNEEGEPVYYCFTTCNRKFFGFVSTIAGAVRIIDKIRDDNVLMEGTVKDFEQAVQRGEIISICGLSNAVNGRR